MPDIQMITDGLLAVLQTLGSLLLAVAVLGGLGIAGAWAMVRNTPCNPYGHDACACGCGTNCEELPGG